MVLLPVVAALASSGLVVWITMMLCGLMGLWDDAMKVVNRRSLGISGKVKMTLLALITVFRTHRNHGTLPPEQVAALVYAEQGWGSDPEAAPR